MSDARPRLFTDAEDALIIRRYGRETLKDIAARLDRRWTVVQQRVNILIKRGLLNPRRRFYAPRWTEREIEFLENNRGRMSDADLARRLGRTEMAVFLKGKRIGALHKTTFLVAKQVAEILGIDQKKVVWLHEHGVLRLAKSATRCGAGNRMWCCELDELDRFLRKETQWYDWHRVVDPVYREIGREANRDPWLTTAQAARIVRMTAGAFTNYVADGTVASVRLPSAGRTGYEYRIRRSALAGFRPKRPELVGHRGRRPARRVA